MTTITSPKKNHPFIRDLGRSFTRKAVESAGAALGGAIAIVAIGLVVSKDKK